ncbi:MAG TPA: lytic transglycosylase domain-containing protein [Burkholderiales bacterium]
MPTKTSLFALSAITLSCHAQLAGAAPAPAASPYRLHVADPQSFRLQTPDREEYRLAKPWRRPEPAPASEANPVSAALAEQAHAEMEAKPYARQIERAAEAANLDPALVHAVVYVESRHHAKAVSVKGAVGLMQVLPGTAARYGIRNLTHADQNLKAGTRYLRALMDQFDDNLELALAAYNAGEGAVVGHANRIPPYRETRDYVKAVLAKYHEWKLPVAAPVITAAPSPAPYGGLATPPLPVNPPTLVAYSDNASNSRLKVVR